MAEQILHHIVVLVHGTWGRGVLPFLRRRHAEWCAPHSTLCGTIRKHLGASAAFEAFSWSGANTVDARLGAARELTKRLADLHKEYPAAHVHVVSHSHGGNIVIYSLNELEWRPHSLVFLSTPFLHVSERNLGTFFGQVLGAGAILTFMCLSTVLFLFAFSDGPIYEASTQALYGSIFLSGGLTAITALLIKRIGRFVVAASSTYVDALQLPYLQYSTNVLILRAAGDEASSLLGAAQLLSSLFTKLARLIQLMTPNFGSQDREALYQPNWFFLPSVVGLVIILSGSLFSVLGSDLGRIWTILLSLWFLTIGFLIVRRGFPSYVRTALFTAILSGLIYALDWRFGVVPYGASDIGLIVGFLLAVSPFIVWAIGACLLGVLGVLVGITLVPFGAKFALAGLGLQIYAEATPPGKWTVVQLWPSTERTLRKDKSFRHSTHSDPMALHYLATWMSWRYRDGEVVVDPPDFSERFSEQYIAAMERRLSTGS